MLRKILDVTLCDRVQCYRIPLSITLYVFPSRTRFRPCCHRFINPPMIVLTVCVPHLSKAADKMTLAPAAPSSMYRAARGKYTNERRLARTFGGRRSTTILNPVSRDIASISQPDQVFSDPHAEHTAEDVPLVHIGFLYGGRIIWICSYMTCCLPNKTSEN